MDRRQKTVGLIFVGAIAINFFIIDKFTIAFLFSVPWALLGILLILFLKRHGIVVSHQKMLLDRHMPRYQFNEIYTLIIRRPKQDVYRKLWEIDYSRSFFLRVLLFLRGKPFRDLVLGKTAVKEAVLLDQKMDEEIVFGLIARPWTFSGQWQTFTPQEFVSWNKQEYIKVAWNVHLTAKSEDQTVLYTEVRFQCSSPRIQRFFAFYWALIRPFSDILQMVIFDLIKKEAESKPR